MKNKCNYLWSLLLVLLGCYDASSESQNPVIIANFGNSFFKPNYQIVAYTGSLAAPTAQNAFVDYNGHALDGNLVQYEDSTNESYSNNSYGWSIENQPALQDIGVGSTTQNLPITSYVGVFNGSLVANGYVTNLNSSNNVAQSCTMGLSGSYAINTPSVQSDPYATAGFNVGLADLSELCQRYGVNTSVIVQPINQGCTNIGPNYVLTLPVTNSLALTVFDDNYCDVGSNLLAVPYQVNSTQNGAGIYAPGWAWIGAGKDWVPLSYTVPSSMLSYTIIPALLSVQNMQTLYDLLSGLTTVGEGVTAGYLNYTRFQAPTNSTLLGVPQATGGGIVSIGYSELADTSLTNVGIFNSVTGFWDISSFGRGLACAESSSSLSSSLLKLKNAPLVAQYTVLQNPLPQFAQLYQWFMGNVNMQFSVSGFPSTLPNSLVSMNGVTTTQPYNAAYNQMLTALTTPAATVIPATTNFTTPTSLGGSIAGQNTLFDAGMFFVPLMMADPLWMTVSKVQNKISVDNVLPDGRRVGPNDVAVADNIWENVKGSGYEVPYEYSSMQVYEWQYENGAWVPGEVAVQKVSCSGDVNKNFNGGLKATTDFDPRKSPMSSFYNELLS